MFDNIPVCAESCALRGPRLIDIIDITTMQTMQEDFIHEITYLKGRKAARSITQTKNLSTVRQVELYTARSRILLSLSVSQTTGKNVHFRRNAHAHVWLLSL